MGDLYIVGAGGFGREVFCWLRDEKKILEDWTFRGFLDDAAEALAPFDYEYGVVGPIRGFVPKPTDAFICGLGTVESKQSVCGALLEQGARFLTLVHPTAVLGMNVKLSDGVVLCPRVTLTCDIEVGAMAMVNCHSSAGHDVKIGAWSTISAHCDLTGHTRLGRSVFLGSGVRVIPGKSIGEGAVVGAGSVVIKSVRAGQKVFGNPARVFA